MRPTVVVPGHFRIQHGTLKVKATSAVIAIGEEPIMIGRGPSCHVSLDDERVSTVHCQLTAMAAGVLVQDLGSKNGVRAGDSRIGPHQYNILDRPILLVVGRSVLEYTPGVPEERTVDGRFGPLASNTLSMQQVLDRAKRLAATSLAVHITGETGTGKEHLARAIHTQSKRADKPFVVVDCAALSPGTLEGELFGYETGSFTGATKRKESPAEVADGGTLFLDEIGDLSAEAQARMLRLVDENVIKRLGSNEYRKVDIRVLSATKHDLLKLVAEGRFREDLYFRLNAAAGLKLPPVRDRPEDFELLVGAILVDLGRPDAFALMDAELAAWLKAQPWPGNVRQIKAVLRAAVELAEGAPLDLREAYLLAGGDAHLADPGGRASDEAITYERLTVHGLLDEAVVREARRIVLSRLLREKDGSLIEVCRVTGRSPRFQRDLLQELGLREIAPPRGSRSS